LRTASATSSLGPELTLFDLVLPPARAAFATLPAEICNRLEICLQWNRGRGSDPIAAAHHLARRAGPPVAELILTEQDSGAIEHLFAVLCGLDSMAVGEEQIVAWLTQQSSRRRGNRRSVGRSL
jgi:glutamyl-tRNA reductase